MKSGLKPLGFTIVETMIFLAVSGAIMVSVLAMVSGSQNKARFQESVNDTDQQINDIVGNVSNGYFSNPVNYKCEVANQTVGPKISTGLGIEKGTNDKCTLLGRVIQFEAGGVSGNMTVYDAVSNRQYDGSDVTNLADSKLKLIAPGTTALTKDFPPAFDSRTLKNGFSAAKISYDVSGSTKPAVGIAILTEFAQSNGGSSAQQINIYAIKGTSLGQTSKEFVDIANDYKNYYKVSKSSPITICFNSATTRQYVEVKLGGSSLSSRTSLEIKDGQC